MAAVGAAACVLAAGCGSLRAGQSATVGTRTTAHRAHDATAAGNKRLARTEARRLVGRAPVPHGAVRIARAPRSVSMPALGKPGVGSLVDLVRVWRLPVPFWQAGKWLRAHPPRGMRRDGSSALGGPTGAIVSGYSYRGPRDRAWQSAELDVEIAPFRGDTVLRADGLVVWLDPRPWRDDARGPRLRVTVKGGCPATDHGMVGVRSPGPGLDHRMVPAGRPVAGLDCSYYGMNGRPWRLHRAVRLTAARARREAARIGRVPLSHTDGGAMSCPMDDDSIEVIVLAYPGRPDVDIWAKTNGCETIANGHISAPNYLRGR